MKWEYAKPMVKSGYLKSLVKAWHSEFEQGRLGEPLRKVCKQ